jgi:hypothetical protein
LDVAVCSLSSMTPLHNPFISFVVVVPPPLLRGSDALFYYEESVDGRCLADESS